MWVYAVRKWPLRGRSRFVCWNITRVSLWLLCNVHFVQSTQRTRLQTRPFVRGINNLLESSCRPITAEGDERVRASFTHSPKKSTGTAAKELSRSKTTVWRVLHKRLVFKPYHIQMVQQLSDKDHRRRLDFCLQLQDLMSSDDLSWKRCSSLTKRHSMSAVQYIVATSEYGDLKTHMPMWSINVTLLRSCFLQSPVKKCTIHSSLLRKLLLAWHIWTFCKRG